MTLTNKMNRVLLSCKTKPQMLAGIRYLDLYLAEENKNYDGADSFGFYLHVRKLKFDFREHWKQKYEIVLSNKEIGI